MKNPRPRAGAQESPAGSEGGSVRTSGPDRDSGRLGDWSGEIVTFGALVVAIAAGAGLFFRVPILMTLGPIAGLVAGLGCRRWYSAIAVAAFGVMIGTAGASLVANPAWRDGFPWLLDAVQTAGVAAAIAAVIALAVHSSERLRPLIAAVAVGAIIGTMWFSAIVVANVPASNGVSNTGNGMTNVQAMATVPTYRPHMSDDDLYLIWVDRLRAGEPYYPMAVRSVAAANAARPSEPLMIRSPFTYRLPTLYMLLAALPPNGISFVMAIMAVCSVGVVAAYVLARQFVRRPLALAGAIIVAAVFSGYGGIILLDTESWAGALSLTAVAAFVMARSRPQDAKWLNPLSVAFALSATAFRELAAPLLVLGLIATLVDADVRETKAWIAWAVGLGIAVVGVIAHWIAASQAFALVTSRPIYASWFSPNGAGLVGAVHIDAALMWLALPACWLLLAVGAIGSAIASKDWPSRIVLAGVAAGGLAVLLFVHPPGETNYGAAPGYWGDIVMPTTLACVPLAFAWVSAVRRRSLGSAS